MISYTGCENIDWDLPPIDTFDSTSKTGVVNPYKAPELNLVFNEFV